VVDARTQFAKHIRSTVHTLFWWQTYIFKTCEDTHAKMKPLKNMKIRGYTA